MLIEKEELEQNLYSWFGHDLKDLVGPQTVDIRLGHQFKRLSYCQNNWDPRKTPAKWNTFNFNKDNKEESFLLEGEEFVLAHSLEFLNLPPNICGQVMGKSTIGRIGLEIQNAGFIDSGFRGQLTLEFKNFQGIGIKLWPGQLIAQVQLYKLKQPEPYGSRTQAHYLDQQGATSPNEEALKRLYRYC